MKKKLLSAFIGASMLLGMGSTASAAEVVEWLLNCKQHLEGCVGSDFYTVRLKCKGVPKEEKPNIYGDLLAVDEVTNAFVYGVMWSPDPEPVCGLVFDLDTTEGINQTCFVHESAIQVMVDKVTDSLDCLPPPVDP